MRTMIGRKSCRRYLLSKWLQTFKIHSFSTRFQFQIYLELYNKLLKTKCIMTGNQIVFTRYQYSGWSYIHIIWQENSVKIKLSERCRWVQLKIVTSAKHFQITHKTYIKLLKHTSVLSVLMKRPLQADFLEQRMLEKICQDLKWSQLNSNVPRNSANQLNFVQDSFCCEYS